MLLIKKGPTPNLFTGRTYSKAAFQGFKGADHQSEIKKEY